VRSLAVYAAAVVCVSVVGGLASSAGQGADGWYESADKPGFTPPGAVFGPVWTALYAALVLVAWRLARIRTTALEAGDLGRSAAASSALRLWWWQLVANFLWTPLFFAAGWLEAGLVDILVLDVLVALLLVRTWRLDRLAGVLLVPYLGWVLFATVLTAGFVVLN
jgi:translocator protein